MKFILPLSPDYVAHWGLWEAVREIYQNALDAGDATITYDDGLLTVTSAGQLTRETLVLGNTSKRNDLSQRGKFGEGYKLALLVLARLGHHVSVFTGAEIWTPRLEYDEEFNSVILNIYREMDDVRNGVTFVIAGVTGDDYDDIQSKIRPEIEATILEEPNECERIYVGGLYVAQAKDFKYGYAFPPNQIKLDRDRGMVDGFDLAYETSKLWTARGGDQAVELVKDEAPDVRYVESHANASSPLTLSSWGYFSATHGKDAVPVSNQDEIQRASKAGIKWVLVPETLKNILRSIKHFFIPSAKDPLDMLRDFRKKYQYTLGTSGLHDLDEIINVMDPVDEEAKIEA